MTERRTTSPQTCQEEPHLQYKHFPLLYHFGPHFLILVQAAEIFWSLYIISLFQAEGKFTRFSKYIPRFYESSLSFLGYSFYFKVWIIQRELHSWTPFSHTVGQACLCACFSLQDLPCIWPGRKFLPSKMLLTWCLHGQQLELISPWAIGSKCMSNSWSQLIHV